MDRHIPDEHLDRLMTRFLAERQAEVVSTARPAAEVVRIGSASMAQGAPRSIAPAMPRSMRLLVVGLSLAALLVALAAGALFVGSRTVDPDADPLAGWVTEEVEPGVRRIVNDGFRDLAPAADERYYRELTTGMDGSIWTWSEQDGELHRLGDPISYPVDGLLGDGAIIDLRIGPDGVPWAGGPYGVFRLDGDALTAGLYRTATR